MDDNAFVPAQEPRHGNIHRIDENRRPLKRRGIASLAQYRCFPVLKRHPEIIPCSRRASSMSVVIPVIIAGALIAQRKRSSSDGGALASSVAPGTSLRQPGSQAGRQLRARSKRLVHARRPLVGNACGCFQVLSTLSQITRKPYAHRATASNSDFTP
jgi:hypothetical protein